MVPRRRLGRSGLEISVLGIGAWAMGGGDWAYGWGPQDDADSIAAILHGAELGINWIDTAPVYGLGHSEEVVGRALRQIPPGERPLVFTKCGHLWDAEPPHTLRKILRPDSLRREVEDSLRRLGVERIDLLQVHHPPEAGSTPLEESWAEMAKLVAEGKVRCIGVSNFDTSLLERCEAVRHIDSLQPTLSLIRRGPAADVIPWCAAHETGVIVYSALRAGLLTDRFSRERAAALDRGDWRHIDPDFRSPQLERNLALRDALIPIARRHDTTVAAVAIAWVLAWPGVSGAIVGARSPSQIDGWVDAATLQLTAEDLDEIAQAIQRTGAGEGPARPPAQHPHHTL